MALLSQQPAERTAAVAPLEDGFEYRDFAPLRPRVAGGWRAVALLGLMLLGWQALVHPGGSRPPQLESSTLISQDAAPAGSALTVSEQLRSASEHLQRDQFMAAVVELEALLNVNPTHAQARLMLAEALEWLGRRDAAVAHYRQATLDHPHWAEAHYRLARALRNSGQRDEAVRAYREVIRLQPDHSEAQLQLGLEFARQKQFSTAADHFHQAASADPSSTMAHYNLGNALAATHDWRGAAAAYRRAIELEDHLPSASVRLAEMLIESGEKHEAAQLLRGVIDSLPEGSPQAEALRASLEELEAGAEPGAAP